MSWMHLPAQMPPAIASVHSPPSKARRFVSLPTLIRIEVVYFTLFIDANAIKLILSFIIASLCLI
jgi:hypothetical protein